MYYYFDLDQAEITTLFYQAKKAPSNLRNGKISLTIAYKILFLFRYLDIKVTRPTDFPPYYF